MGNTTYMVDVTEAMGVLGCSRGKAYEVIAAMNKELKNQNFIVIAGKVPRSFWNKKLYGLTENLR